MPKIKLNIALFLLASSALIIVIAVLIARRNSNVPDITTHEPEAATPAGVSRPYEHRITPDRETVQDATMPVIEWTVYVGGSDNDSIGGISLAPDGYIYVSGRTGSEDIEGHLNTTHRVSAYVSKISDKGEIIWSKYVGGKSMDLTGTLSVDTEGIVYIAGYTYLGDLPEIPNGMGGEYVGFVDKLSGEGDGLWQIYIGGERQDKIRAIAVSSDNEKIFVIGETQSRIMNNRFVNDHNQKEKDDGFIASLDREGNLIWIKFIAGQEKDIPIGLTLSDDGEIYITGDTYSDDLPKRTNEYSGERDAFVTKMSPDGEILWTTYVGSPGRDTGNDIALDSEGNV